MGDPNYFECGYEPDWDHPIYASGEAAPRVFATPLPESSRGTTPSPISNSQTVERLTEDVPPWEDDADTNSAVAQLAKLNGQTPVVEPEQATVPGMSPALARVALPIRKEFLVPALMSRSALFSAGTGKGQHWQPERALACYKPYGLRLEGPRLTMRDKAVWEQFMRAALSHGFADEEFVISLSGISKALGGWGSGEASKSVLDSLRRLSQARISYARHSVEGSGRLIGSLRHEDRGARKRSIWRASFDGGLAPLLERDAGCRCLVEQRRKLRTQLAEWLHDFLGSNKPYQYSVGKLRELSGYEAAADQFPSKLREALAEVKNNAPGVLTSFEFDCAAKNPNDWQVAAKTSDDPNFVMPRADLIAREQANKTSGASRPPFTLKRRGGVAL